MEEEVSGEQRSGRRGEEDIAAGGRWEGYGALCVCVRHVVVRGVVEYESGHGVAAAGRGAVVEEGHGRLLEGHEAGVRRLQLPRAAQAVAGHPHVVDVTVVALPSCEHDDVGARRHGRRAIGAHLPAGGRGGQRPGAAHVGAVDDVVAVRPVGRRLAAAHHQDAGAEDGRQGRHSGDGVEAGEARPGPREVGRGEGAGIGEGHGGVGGHVHGAQESIAARHGLASHLVEGVGLLALDDGVRVPGARGVGARGQRGLRGVEHGHGPVGLIETTATATRGLTPHGGQQRHRSQGGDH